MLRPTPATERRPRLDDQLSDAELVAQAQEDPQRFARIYERYVQKLYSYVYYRTGDTSDAEDLTARVFVQAMNHLPRYRERGIPISAWLYRIAHNLIANWHRDNGRRKVVPLDDHVAHSLQAEEPETVTESREEHARLLDAVRQLPPERQELIILKFVERMSNAEIGKVMGRSEGAIKSLYHRTLLALRDYMKKHQGTPEDSSQYE